VESDDDNCIMTLNDKTPTRKANKMDDFTQPKKNATEEIDLTAAKKKRLENLVA
jgi:hypothetical protein